MKTNHAPTTIDRRNADRVNFHPRLFRTACAVSILLAIAFVAAPTSSAWAGEEGSIYIGEKVKRQAPRTEMPVKTQGQSAKAGENLSVNTFRVADPFNPLVDATSFPGYYDFSSLIELTIDNPGDAITTPFTVTLKFEPFFGDPIASGSVGWTVVDGVPAGAIGYPIVFDSAYIPYDGTASAIGDLRVNLDAWDIIPEVDEADNSAVVQLGVTALGVANLEVVEFSTTTGDIPRAVDFQSFVTLRVRNNTLNIVPANTARIDLLLFEDVVADPDTIPFATLMIPTDLLAGETLLIDLSGQSLRHNARLGANILRVVLDRLESILETNEFDNDAEIPITVVENPTGECVYAEDFQGGESGWTTVAVSEGVQEEFWNRTSYDDEGVQRGVWWCGTTDPFWADPEGYGNNWDQRLTKTFALPPGTVNLSYSLQFDTEPGYDYVRIEVFDVPTQSWLILREHSGISAGFESFSDDLSVYQGQTVDLRFRFTSDWSWSDEDGSWPSNGACRLDRVQVSGYPADEFESGGDGWVPSFPSGEVPFSFRLEEKPLCYSSVDPLYDCAFYTNGDSAETCNAWVAYDPATGRYPFRPQADVDAGRATEIGILSPVFELPVDATTFVLALDVLSDLPTANGVFYRWAISSPAGSPFDDDNLVYWGSQGGWRQVSFDVSQHVTPGSTVQIQLSAWDGGFAFGFPGTEHTAAPYFDNVQMLAYNGTGTGQLCDSPRGCDTIVADRDGDGVPDGVDGCPDESGAPFDSDGDGCRDELAGARHIEYWRESEFPLRYVIHEDGAFGVGVSTFSAIQEAMDTWGADPETEVAFVYDGTTTEAVSDVLDGVNLITFSDFEYPFPSAVLAVGLSTSFEVPTQFQGAMRRPGEIVDFDIIFNPGKAFKTDTEGPAGGSDIQAVCVHEAGHGVGMAHASIPTSTMFFVLPEAVDARTLELDDQMAMLKAYPAATTLETRTRIVGSVVADIAGVPEPVPGVIVFAHSIVDLSKVACEYTLPDGSFQFVGLPAGDYYISIHGLDASEDIGFISPANINQLIFDTAVTTIVPEFYNVGDAKDDLDGAKSQVTAVVVAPPASPTPITIVLDVDELGPIASADYPLAGSNSVVVSAPVKVRFDEAIDDGSISGNFFLRKVSPEEFISGTAAVFENGALLSFVPSSPFDFDTDYRLEILDGITDVFGNRLQAPLTVLFRTEPQPAVGITSLSPSRGVAGTIVVAGGVGFDELIAGNALSINGSLVPLIDASVSQIVFAIPDDAVVGDQLVTVEVDNIPSAPFIFSVIAPQELARGFEMDAVQLQGTPRALSLAADGSKAFMATDAGFSIVDLSTGAGYAHTPIAIAGGLSELDEIPDASVVFAVSKVNEKIYQINVNPDVGPISVINEQDLGARPLGILIEPSGRRAFIPTNDAGRIIVWDVNPSSPTFDTPLDVITSSDPNLRGKMATDPTGAHLYLLTSTGDLLDLDLGTQTFAGAVNVGLDPEDLVVNRTGSRAFVSTADGHVAIVNLTSLTREFDVRTGGTLMGIDIAAAGSFVYAVNHDLDKLDVIDLQPGSPTLLTVATRIDQQVNPVDVELSSDGLFAYSIVESSQQLVVNAIGIGPELSAQSLNAGPAGSKLVLAGSGLDDDAVTTVSFDGITVILDRLSATSLTVTVPPGASSGPVLVVGTNGSEQTSVSNAVFFEVLESTVGTSLRLSGSTSSTPSPAIDGGSAMARSGSGDQLVMADLDGGVHIYDLDPTSESFNSILGSLAATSLVTDIVLSPDGAQAYLLRPVLASILVADVNRRSTGFLSEIASVDLSSLTGSAAGLMIASDGRELLVSDPDGGQVHVVDLVPGSASLHQVSSAIALDDASVNGRVAEMAMHPAGAVAYLPVQDSDPAVIRVLDMDPASGVDYHTVVASYGLPGVAPQAVPTRIEFTPDGNLCLVLTRGESGLSDRTLLLLDTSDPLAPVLVSQTPLGVSAAATPDDLAISPRSDRAVVSVQGVGLFNYELQSGPAALLPLEQTGDVANHASGLELEYAADGTALLALSASSEVLLSYDFLTVQTMVIAGGNGQTGVVNQALPGELRVRLSSASDPTQGVPVTFTVTGGGGVFTLSGLSSQTVLTDINGIADIDLSLGPDLGAQTVEASSFGVVNSPLGFDFTAVEDPDTIPMTVVSVSPGGGALDVNVTTGLQVVFSRAVDVESVTPTAFRLLDAAAITVPAVTGFSDGNRRLSITPSEALSYDTSYALEIVGITDASGGALVDDPVSSSFTTTLPLPISLDVISPPSARRNTPITLSGRSFEPGSNTVLFGTVEAVISSESATSITVIVPLELVAGSYPVVVQTSTETSTPLTFIVLEPKISPVDDVLASAGTSSSTRAVTITPDGTLAYAVSPDANLVIPITLDGSLTPLPAIPVGENPFAIIMHPDGNTAYVTNLISGSVSVIDTDPGSDTYHSVIEEIGVGTGPMDLVIDPFTDRLIVANAGSDDLSIIDSDNTSATYHQVLSTTRTGATTRTVTISPDGTRLYAGTDDGYIVLETISFGVLSTTRTGSSTRQVTISPDGTLLVLLTSAGQIIVYDVAPGSASENSVIASTRGGTTTRSVTISPDGTLLYAVQADVDVIFVYSLEFTAGVSVLSPDSILGGFDLETVATVETGENPAWVAFDPSGETDNIIVTNAGDNTVTLLGTPTAPTISYFEGAVTADCPSSGTPLFGVEVAVFSTETGEMVHSLLTDEAGHFTETVDPGEYVIAVVTPLAYTIEDAEQYVFVTGSENDPTIVDFELECVTTPANPRPMIWWKHQLSLALWNGWWAPQVEAEVFCEYLDTISEHFSSHRINPVQVYEPPSSGLCQDKMQVARSLFNFWGNWTKESMAKQQLLALLFNVASGRLSLNEVISDDGSKVSHAITFVDNLIDDGDPSNDLLALRTARKINIGRRVAAGTIPNDLPDIQYKDGVPVRFELMQNYPNPFNPRTKIFFALPQRSQVGLIIYDASGRRVRVLINEEMESGLHFIIWDGQNHRGRRVASGVYFYRLLAGDFEQTKKMLLVK